MSCPGRPNCDTPSEELCIINLVAQHNPRADQEFTGDGDFCFAPVTAIEEVGRQLRRAGKLDLDRAVHLVPADDIFGASTEQAMAHASAWLGSTRHDSPLTETGPRTSSEYSEFLSRSVEPVMDDSSGSKRRAGQSPKT